MTVNGYYEWDETNPNKLKPYIIKSEEEGELLYLACLYNNAFHEKIGESYNHFVVLTMNAASSLEKIHHRMPVFLNEKTKEMWLDPNCKFQDVFKEIIESRHYQDGGLTFYQVGEIVNSIKNDTPDCILTKAEYEA